MCDASAAVNTATKNMNNMLLRWKYCSIDDTNPNTNPKLGMYRLTIRYSVSAEYLTIRYYLDPVK